MARRAFVSQGFPPTPPLGSWHHWRENLTRSRPPGQNVAPAPRGTRARPQDKTQSSRPHGHGCPRSRPASAPPLPGASQRPFVPPSPGTLVPEKFRKKNQRQEAKPASAASLERAGSVGQGQGGHCGGRSPFQGVRENRGAREIARVSDYTLEWKRWIFFFK